MEYSKKCWDQKVSVDANVAGSLLKLGGILKLKDESKTALEQTNRFRLVCLHVTERTNIIQPISSHVPLTLRNASNGLILLDWWMGNFQFGSGSVTALTAFTS